MKRNYFFLLFIPFMFIACSRGNSNASKNEKTKSVTTVAAVKTINIEVKGMTCEGCENTIEKALTDLDGVISAEASHTKAVTVISYDSTKVDRDLLSQTINNLGYEALK